MRNRHYVRLEDCGGNLMVFIKPGECIRLPQQGTVRIVKRTAAGVINSISFMPPPPSGSSLSAPSLTFAATLAKVGLPVRAGHYVSRGRVQAIQEKVQAFAEMPAVADRIRKG